ncbi:hypothetical protein UAY_01952 [Enterococcus moraviensis ATCC BAA-383]|uniref:Uncharacterized protein n=1 Tax=Enterococcus moraviensis ATCC BAA-383 TaxID=1158609 RepID=R2SVA6_9ENTE|nr:hypothetical protein [Enterococcus moraviensis]EOH99175.1 hypothetical protein UAY_01952 [Enterococcus moraviensis ATCC BAA-383]EOT72142.1 hypothetical protein I586_01950 [Enterococcus moraviensis ATCC BAA-383]OJG67425.1 hypothetical protein RV09_GL002641 [Enterococcus moraviensis]
MKKKFVLILSIFLVLIGGYFIFFRKQTKKIVVKEVIPEIEQLMTTNEQAFIPKKKFQSAETKERRDRLKFFIDARMLQDDGGIATNYLAQSEESEVATGHELLSESSGIYLRNLELTDTKERFDSFYKKTKDLFYEDVQFSYRIDENGKKYPVNASVDDLRIIRALIGASGHFGLENYQKEIDDVTKNFMDTSMDENVLIDFYDIDHKKKSMDTSLFYIDLKVLGYLYKKYDVSSDYLQYHYDLINNGYLSDSFPFYQTKFNHKEEKYENTGTINIIESLLTILHLGEVDLQKQESIDFIKAQVRKGTLFNSYDLNGIPVDKNQSAASYALAALIGVAINDEELYDSAILILNNFQIDEVKNPLYGGFGDIRTKEVFSYNNLMALLAYDY